MNEGLVSGAVDGEPQPVSVSILCECGHSGCRAELEVNLDFYRGMCLRSNQFVVANGHEVVEVDRVVRRLGGLTIVESTYIGDALPPAA